MAQPSRLGHDAVLIELPIHEPVGKLRLRLAFQRGNDAYAIDPARRLTAGKLSERGHHVGKVNRRVTRLAGRYVAWPPRDERLTNAALRYIAFVAPQRAVRIVEVRIVATFLVRAIVRRKNHQRVVVN